MLQSTLFIGGTPEWLPSPSLNCLYSRTGVQLNESGERDMNGKQQQAHKESSTHIMRFAVRFDVYSSRALLAGTGVYAIMKHVSSIGLDWTDTSRRSVVGFERIHSANKNEMKTMLERDELKERY